MTDRQELQARRALRAAREAGDERAELEARRALRALTSAPPIPEPIRPELAPTPDIGAGPAFGRAAVLRLVNNALGFPEAAMQGMLSSPFGENAPPLFLPAAVIPRGIREQVIQTVQDVTPTAEGLLGTVTGQDVAARSAAIEAQHPAAATTGEIAGDVATLFTGRAPIGVMARTGRLAEHAALTALGRIIQLSARHAPAKTSGGRLLQATGRGAAKVAGRAGEAGIEGAALAALQDADPAEVGATAAGIQGGAGALASAGIAGIKKFKLTGAVAGAFVLSLVAQEVIPGGYTQVWRTLKDSAQHVGIGALIAGAITPFTGRLPKDTIPKLLGGPAAEELATLIPRGTMLSLLSAARENPTVGEAAVKFTENPDFAGSDERQALERAFSGKADADKVVTRLMRDSPQFARAMGRSSPAVVQADNKAIGAAISADTRDVNLPRPRKLAESVARILGDKEAKRLGFGTQSTGPRAFIRRAVERPELLEKMGRRQRRDALAVALDGLLLQSVRTVDGKRMIDGPALRAAWERVPETVKRLYPTRSVIEAFVALDGLNGGVSALTAEALMLNGELARSLVGGTGGLLD